MIKIKKFLIFAIIIAVGCGVCYFIKDKSPKKEIISQNEFINFFTNENTTNSYKKFHFKYGDNLEAWIDDSQDQIQAKIVYSFESESYLIYLFNGNCYVHHVDTEVNEKFMFELNFDNIRTDYQESRVGKVVNIVAPLQQFCNMNHFISNELNIALAAPDAQNSFYKTQFKEKVKYNLKSVYDITIESITEKYNVDAKLIYKDNKLLSLSFEKTITKSSDSSIYVTTFNFNYEQNTTAITFPSLTGYSKAN